jgi:hypothetical protein
MELRETLKNPVVRKLEDVETTSALITDYVEEVRDTPLSKVWKGHLSGGDGVMAGVCDLRC